MRAGLLDRRLTIERKSETPSPSGAPVEDWTALATVWAQARPNRGDERFAIRQLVGSSVMTFAIRYRADLALTVKDRLSYDGKTWDILDIRQLGRNDIVEMDAKARADAT